MSQGHASVARQLGPGQVALRSQPDGAAREPTPGECTVAFPADRADFEKRRDTQWGKTKKKSNRFLVLCQKRTNLLSGALVPALDSVNRLVVVKLNV